MGVVRARNPSEHRNVDTLPATTQQAAPVIEVFASEETGSWTILLTSPQGLTCLMAAGEAYETDPEQAAGNPT